MAAMFRIDPEGLELAPGTLLLKADEWARFSEAETLIQAARAEAEAMRLRAAQAYEEEKARGLEDGLKQGKMEHAEKMIDTVLKALDYISGLESGMVALVGDALRKILGEIPPDELIVKVVRQALAMVQNRQRVTLRLSPEDEALVSAGLEEILRPYPGIKAIDVLADGRLSRGDCLLESEMGVIDASVETQLKAIANAFEKHQKG